MIRIVDTSVIVKWAVREEGWEDAAVLIGSALIAPDLLKAELANALWKKVRRQEISAEHALITQAEAQDALHFVPVMSLSVRALEIGIDLNHAIYDCFYLALAEVWQTVLVTSDKRLCNKCDGTAYAALIEAV